MATTTQPQVLNLTIAVLNGLLPFDLPYGSEPVYIIDGSPGPNQPDNMVTVMPLPSDGTRAQTDWEDTVKGRIEEYDVQIHVWCYVGGAPDPNSLSTAQLQARTNAATIEAAIENAFLVDTNLSVINNGTAAITWQLPSVSDYTQTTTAEDDGKGRYAQFDMVLHVYNYLAGPGS